MNVRVIKVKGGRRFQREENASAGSKAEARSGIFDQQQGGKGG